ncbi:Uncharacterised protein [Mycobacteroides abscessus subsp. abscessus]|nr:Uncharacterised protein [Mycobacteroides abscessus subsp. abscessus]
MGQGAYCTSTPASKGPRPRPPVLATVATAAARPRHVSGADSMTATVAAPVKKPADSPETMRATNSSGTESTNKKMTELRIAKPAPVSNSGRRPRTSDQPPNISSANSTPAA